MPQQLKLAGNGNIFFAFKTVYGILCVHVLARFLIYIHNKNSSLHLYYELASERIEEKLAF